MCVHGMLVYGGVTLYFDIGGHRLRTPSTVRKWRFGGLVYPTVIFSPLETSQKRFWEALQHLCSCAWGILDKTIVTPSLFSPLFRVASPFTGFCPAPLLYTSGQCSVPPMPNPTPAPSQDTRLVWQEIGTEQCEDITDSMLLGMSEHQSQVIRQLWEGF